jgi:hypothetical protein
LCISHLFYQIKYTRNNLLSHLLATTTFTQPNSFVTPRKTILIVLGALDNLLKLESQEEEEEEEKKDGPRQA